MPDFKKAEVRMSAWMKSDTDRMLDLYFSGESQDRISDKMDVPGDSINRRLHAFIDNVDHRVEDYEPLRRVSRRGRDFTTNETHLLAVHKDRKVPVEDTARLLQRDVSELRPDVKGKAQAKEAWLFATSLDYFLACRYACDHYEVKIVSDADLKDMEAEERELGGASGILNAGSLPKRIISLAMYLVLRKEDDAKHG